MRVPSDAANATRSDLGVGVDLRALTPIPTGTGIYTRSLLLALAERGGARYFGLAPRRPAAADELEQAGVRIESQPSPSGLLWQQLRLPGRLAQPDIDLLWSPLFTLPLRSSVPGVVTVHDLTILEHPETHSMKVRMSLQPLLRSSLGRASAIVVDSVATGTDVRRYFPKVSDKVSVIYPGVDATFRPASEDAIEGTRRELGCPEGYLLFAGTLEPRKNVSRLLAAWSHLRRKHHGTPPLVLAGPYGWRSSELLERIGKLRDEGLIHVGHLKRSRLIEIFQAATVFVYPSLYEGFGLPVAEAMACGVPVVTSNCSSLPEVVGDAGIQVDPSDTAALQEAIEILLESSTRRDELAARGLTRVRRFDWVEAARRMESIFRQAAG